MSQGFISLKKKDSIKYKNTNSFHIEYKFNNDENCNPVLSYFNTHISKRKIWIKKNSSFTDVYDYYILLNLRMFKIES